MPISYLGLGLSCVALLGWGTALVPLKLAGNKRNGVLLCTLAVSAGYLLSAGVAAAVLLALGSQAWASSGLLGGVIWGLGKILNILSVAGPAGLAGGQAGVGIDTVLTEKNMF